MLQSSGTISLYDINIELGRSGTATIGLDDAENGAYGAINTCSPAYPNSLNPASLAEWYSYDHSAACCPAYGTFAYYGSCPGNCLFNENEYWYYNGTSNGVTGYQYFGCDVYYICLTGCI